MQLSVRTGNLCSLAPLIKSNMELVLSYLVETTDTDPGIIGVIIGVIIAVVLVLGSLGLVLLAVCCCYHNYKRKSKYEVNSTDTQMSSLILIVMA